MTNYEQFKGDVERNIEVVSDIDVWASRIAWILRGSINNARRFSSSELPEADGRYRMTSEGNLDCKMMGAMGLASYVSPTGGSKSGAWFITEEGEKVYRDLLSEGKIYSDKSW